MLNIAVTSGDRQTSWKLLEIPKMSLAAGLQVAHFNGLALLAVRFRVKGHIAAFFGWL